jgi:septum formation protein
VDKTKKLILASASPRRRELLDQLGVSYNVDPADIDETGLPQESPEDYVQRMAMAADTSVVIDGDVLGKPVDHFGGLAMLARLSGRKHTVITAVCLLTELAATVKVVTSAVQFIVLSREVCEAYLATDEPWDKAGAYGIQGLGGAFVNSLEGSYSNVVGLPLSETWQLLTANGIATHLGTYPDIRHE